MSAPGTPRWWSQRSLRQRTVGVLLGCIALLPGVPGAAERVRSLAEIRATGGNIVLATEGRFPPFNELRGAELTGFEVELAQQLLARMGLHATWKTAEFRGLLDGLAQGQWDMVVASHSITEERARIVTFADPHYCSGGVIVSASPSIRTRSDLAGRTLAVQSDTQFQKLARSVPGIRELRSFEQDTDARSALLSGRVDVWVTDRIAALDLERRLGKGRVTIGDFLYLDRIGAAVARGNSALVEAWNRALAAAQADGSYEALSRRYFGEDVRCH